MRALLDCLRTDDLAGLERTILSGLSIDAKIESALAPSDPILSSAPTLLQVSAFFGSSRCFRYLFTMSANYRTVDAAGCSILHFASAGGSLELLSMLQSTDLDWAKCDRAGNSCVHYAAMFNHLNIVAWLWATCMLDLMVRNKRRMTPLHIAAMNGSGDAVRFLVRNGCGVNDRDANGLTPLHHAASRTDLGTVQALIECGADVTMRDNAGCLAYDWAARWGQRHIQRFILDCMPCF
jgi:ankyrin repeat protein